ncbi:hypothetical protein B5M44_03085 [Shinella sumterensis]|nr:hypothetical protein B5M44_03085 [Shinella sumterensis]
MKAYTPLCPAGHLPHKGGDRVGWATCPCLTSIAGTFLPSRSRRRPRELPISPLVGEMPGRAEGGVAAPRNPMPETITTSRSSRRCACP